MPSTLNEMTSKPNRLICRVFLFLGAMLMASTITDMAHADGLFPELGPDFGISSRSRSSDVYERFPRARDSYPTRDRSRSDDVVPRRSRRPVSTTPPRRYQPADSAWENRSPEGWFEPVSRPVYPDLNEFPDFNDVGREPIDLRSEPSPSSKIDPDTERTLRLTARYQDPMMVRFIRSLSVQKAMQLYSEISQLIDSRHIKPVSYAERTAYSLGNLERALNNRSFLAAAGVQSAQINPQVVAELASMRSRARNVRDFNGAMREMQSAINLLGRGAGVSSSFVAMEFVFGAAETHDRYSAFEPDKDAGGPSASLDEHVVGIGVEIKVHDDGAEVVRVLRNSPAANARLQPSDLITAIDGRSIGGMNIAQIADRITGPQGSGIRLQVERNGRAYNAALTRARVAIESVSDARIIDQADGVGYIRLEKFASTSEKEVDAALWNLHQQGMKSLVLDLRGNPGGLLTTAISLCDKFLPCGNIVSTRGRLQSDSSSASANRSKTWRIPLVVLIDNNSASASEIFAAAVQENGRGVVVGRRSYGKGTVQTHFPLRSVKGNLRLTTAHFYSPTGRKMSGEGVIPDVAVSRVSERSAASQDRVDLSRAIEIAQADKTATLAANAAQCRQPQPGWLIGQTGR